MAESRCCSTCGAPIPPDAPGGHCPRCLIDLGFENQEKSAAECEAAASRAAAERFVPPPAEEVAKLFPQLEILEFLGAGGMGAVYKARQPNLDRFVAVKILPPEVSQDPAFAERFTREAKSMARLNHPGIVAIHDFGKANGLFYFIMEFVDGATLRQTMQTGCLKPKESLAIVTQICEALQYAHDAGVMHRDIKPENILLNKQGRIKIADFGLSKLILHDRIAPYADEAASLTDTHQIIGTLRYMAPEQLRDTKRVDHRADIYSLGVVIYEMLTGDVPAGHFAPPSRKVEIDVRLDEIVLRALAEEPSQRYQQVNEVKTDVEVVQNTTATTPSASMGDWNATLRSGQTQDSLAARNPVFLANRILTVMGLLMITSAVLTILLQFGVFVDTYHFDSFFRHDGVAISIFILQCMAISTGILMIIAGQSTREAGPVDRNAGSIPEHSTELRTQRLSGRTSNGVATCRPTKDLLPRIAAILGLIPLTAAWPITLPLGIWTLVLIRQRA